MPPEIPKWRQRLAQEKRDETESPKPLRPIKAAREVLVITLSEAQWDGLKDQARISLSKAFEKVRQYLTQIGTLVFFSSLIKNFINQLGRLLQGTSSRTFYLEKLKKKLKPLSNLRLTFR